ncbi:MAG: glycosyltransferase [Bacteroidetes bacterium]|nr:glycosyltransferase [Bacteroidota bacterium]
MKKILLIASWYPTIEKPQSGIFIHQQAALLTQKYDVKVLVCNPIIVGRKGFIKDFFVAPKKIENSIFIVDKNLELLEYNVKEYVFLGEETRYKIIFSSYLFYLKRLFANWKPDIIHAHDPLLAGVLANYISSYSNIPFVLTSHNPLFINTRSCYINKLVLNSFIKADKLLTVGNQDKRILDSLINTKFKTITLGNVVDTGTFNPIKKIKNEKSKFKIINISSTSLRKDIPTFLRAINYYIENYDVSKKNIEVLLIVSEVMDGYSFKEMYIDIESLGLKNITRILSNVKYHTVIANEMLDSDVFISTSYYETFGIAVAEAISAGIPTIAVDNGAVRDFVSHKENGLIVEMGDYESIANYVNKIETKEIVFDEKKMHNSIAAKFSKDVYLEKLMTIYSNVLSSKKATYS